ncbi:MAG TPA: phytanoyl-CoA dioxygenase family protein [Acidimicrobiales bacterium]|nr:phytanoyl-CoA dioxygenase family protein [Acidimicrobiales bacterium]
MGLEHFAPTAAAADVHAALVRDGAVIVDDVLDAATIATLREQLAEPLATTAPGVEEFSGLNTRRFGALIERAPATRPLVTHPLVLEVTKLLLSDASAVQLHLTQAICIGPNSPAQLIHRDQWAFDFFAFPLGYEVQCNTIWAITDFTEDNGATRVAVGTNHAENDLKLTQSDTVGAVMRAGSVVIYTGAVYHGGGANVTDDETRIGVNITYNRGWLRQEENQYLAVSRECAATLDEQLLRLMGYQKGAFALGYIDDLRDPIAAVRPEFANPFGFAVGT